MIQEVQNKKGSPAITSDRWHVVHSRCVDVRLERPFTRSIESEHDQRADCVRAARKLRRELAAAEAEVPAAQRDEVFVRPPGYKSLRQARRRAEKRE